MWRGTGTRAFRAGTCRLGVLVQSDELTHGDQPAGTGLLCLPITQGPLSLPLQPWASSARTSTWRSRGSRGSSRESTSAAPPTMSQRPSCSESKSPSTVSTWGPSGDRGGAGEGHCAAPQGSGTWKRGTQRPQSETGGSSFSEQVVFCPIFPFFSSSIFFHHLLLSCLHQPGFSAHGEMLC